MAHGQKFREVPLFFITCFIDRAICLCVLWLLKSSNWTNYPLYASLSVRWDVRPCHSASCITAVSLSGKCGHAYVLLPRPTSTIVLCIMILFCGCADAVDVTWSYPFYASSPKQKWDFVRVHKAREWRAASKGRAEGWFSTTGFYKCRHLKNICVCATL